MIRLYNTMDRQIETLEPIEAEEVSIYTCGPTVYDFPHIGNWYAFIRWDLLVRILQASGFNTKWVMNITDVGHLTSDADEGEDKLEKGARREHKSAWEVAKDYTDYFEKGLDRLNFFKPDILPKATDNIPEQINFIKSLEAQGLTYRVDDGVYFDTSKISDYGKLARLKIEGLKEGARVQSNPQKKNTTDFALWKFSLAGQKRDMEWDSPWGKGFPGWHLECSALIQKYLGNTIDIHGGGIDHIPVHHTNEIAQSESAHHKTLANFWLHSNFVKIDNQKMSKSLGNLVTLEDIETKGFSLEAFRLLVFESHYRSEAQFTWDTLSAAQNRLNKYHAMSQLQFQPTNTKTSISTSSKTSILEFLQNDLNTPMALSSLSDVSEQLLDCGVSTKNIHRLIELIQAIDNMFGFKLMQEQDISKDQKELIHQREEVRKNKNWVKSDELRGKLKEQGIELRDTQFGPIWSRI